MSDDRPDLCRHCNQPIIVGQDDLPNPWIHTTGYYACDPVVPTSWAEPIITNQEPEHMTDIPTINSITDVPQPAYTGPERRAVVDDISAVRAELQRYIELSERNEQAHHDDIAAISARFNREARERGWCGEYADVINDLNKTLSLPLTLSRTYNVELTYSVTVVVENVAAANATEAEDEAYGYIDERLLFTADAMNDQFVEDGSPLRVRSRIAWLCEHKHAVLA